MLWHVCTAECPTSEEDADGVLESLKQQKDDSIASPFCIPSVQGHMLLILDTVERMCKNFVPSEHFHRKYVLSRCFSDPECLSTIHIQKHQL